MIDNWWLLIDDADDDDNWRLMIENWDDGDGEKEEEGAEEVEKGWKKLFFCYNFLFYCFF